MFTKMVDLALTDEEKMACDVPCGPIDRPKYPYGLSLSFDQATLDKLKLDTKDVSVGDMIDIRAFGTITSISENDTADGPKCRVEIQLEKIAVEDEATEETPEPEEKPEDGKPESKGGRLRKLYDKAAA